MVVVTGASGQTGQALVRELASAGYQVRIVAPNLHSPGYDEIQVERAVGNVDDPVSLINAFAGADMVFHCDTQLNLLPWYYPSLYKHNVRGTENVVRAARVARVRKLVFVSSILAIGYDHNHLPLSESVGFRPHRALNAYGKTMALASKKVLDAASEGLEVVIMCPAATLGPWDYSFTPVGNLIWEFARGHAHFSARGGLDLLDVRDLAKATRIAAEKAPSKSIYLLSGGHISLERLLKTLHSSTNINRHWIHMPRWMLDLIALAYELRHRVQGGQPLYTWAAVRIITANMRSNTHKAKEELGFDPRPLKTTIQDTWGWYKEHHHFLY